MDPQSGTVRAFGSALQALAMSVPLIPGFLFLRESRKSLLQQSIESVKGRPIFLANVVSSVEPFGHLAS